MSDCVTLQADGTLVPTGQPVTECTGYVLVSSAEHAQMSFLSSLFQWPTPEVAGSWLVGCFAFVMVCHVAGSMTGSVVSFISTLRR